MNNNTTIMEKLWRWMKAWPPIVGWATWCLGVFIARGGIYRDSVGGFFGPAVFILIASVAVFGPLSIALLRGLPVEKIGLAFTGAAIMFIGFNYSGILASVVSGGAGAMDGPSLLYVLGFSGLGLSFYALLMKAYAVKA